MSEKQNKRKEERFLPDPLTYAQIDINLKKDQFSPTHIGLIMDTSQKGCGLVVSSKTGIKKGSECLIKVGDLPVYHAEVKWIIKLDKDLLKAGFEYHN